jgi:2-polyprenyl-3-methyl-5-hydroxy-6-metoxy-1,4-benzoquinol methylase
MNWKGDLYEKYVSDGQGGHSSFEPFNSHLPYFKKAIFKHIPKDKNSKIIDLGCGIGAYIHFLKTEGYFNVVGVDVSPEQVSLAKQNGLKEVIQSDLGGYVNGLLDESVDVFILKDVIEHFSKAELFELFYSIFIKIRVGGKVIIHTPNSDGIFGSKILYSDLTHETSFTKMSLSQFGRHMGFSQIVCFEDKPIVHGVKSFTRRIIWEILTIPFRLLLLSENGSYKGILSQNILTIYIK